MSPAKSTLQSLLLLVQDSPSVPPGVNAALHHPISDCNKTSGEKIQLSLTPVTKSNHSPNRPSTDNCCGMCEKALYNIHSLGHPFCKKPALESPKFACRRHGFLKLGWLNEN